MDFIEMSDFLKDNQLSREQLDEMWDVMREHNWKIKSLDNSGKRWSGLTKPAILSLVKQHQELLAPNQ